MTKSKDLKVVVVEDEAPTKDLLVNYILTRNELKLCGVARDGEEAHEILAKGECDLVFLDINLPILSGFEVIEKLENPPYIIFTTALADRAVEAFELGAVDYLLKPFSKDRFNKAVDRALSFFKDSGKVEGTIKQSALFLTEKENYFLIPFAEILYVSSHDNSSVVHTEEREYVTYVSLKAMEQRLPKNFFRIYKQFIINLDHVSKVQSDQSGSYTVHLKDEDETQLPVGRTYLAQLKDLLT